MAHPAHHNTQSRSDAAWLWTGDLPTPSTPKPRALKRTKPKFGKKRAA